jgi:outer membrane immunogenic protein
MNKLILSGLAFTALAVSPAMSADMPVKAAAPIAPAFSWTGLYVGVNGGGAVAQSCFAFDPGPGIAPLVSVDDGCHYATGAFGGGQVGFNWQAGSWVVGVEATGDWGNLDGAANGTFFTAVRWTTRVKSFYSVTGRLGFLASPTVLVYAKGGGGWAREEYSDLTIPGLAVFATANETRGGWAAGAGAEWAFLPNLSIGVDYTYIGLGRKAVTFTPVAAGVPFSANISQNLQALTVKLNYKFWGMM